MDPLTEPNTMSINKEEGSIKEDNGSTEVTYTILLGYRSFT